MAWLRRWFGGARTDATTPDAAAAERSLTAAGWRPGRAVDSARAEHALEAAGFQVHDAARRFLGEYYGLSPDVPVAGADGITAFVHFDPEMVLRFLGPADRPRLAALMAEGACPVGTAGGHTAFVFLDGDGRSFLLDMEWTVFAELADTPAEAVRVLCDGRNGRVDADVLDGEGRRTGDVIRAADERRHWRLDEVPRVARFLPPVSLSPARRPPTWRAMVRAAEKALAGGATPAEVLVTCGGFATAPSGETYFVAHDETCLYVRARAGLRVTSPPPGLTADFRPGEVIPYRMPAGGA